MFVGIIIRGLVVMVEQKKYGWMVVLYRKRRKTKIARVPELVQGGGLKILCVQSLVGSNPTSSIFTFQKKANEEWRAHVWKYRCRIIVIVIMLKHVV